MKLKKPKEIAMATLLGRLRDRLSVCLSICGWVGGRVKEDTCVDEHTEVRGPLD